MYLLLIASWFYASLSLADHREDSSNRHHHHHESRGSNPQQSTSPPTNMGLLTDRENCMNWINDLVGTPQSAFFTTNPTCLEIMNQGVLRTVSAAAASFSCGGANRLTALSRFTTQTPSNMTTGVTRNALANCSRHLAVAISHGPFCLNAQRRNDPVLGSLLGLLQIAGTPDGAALLATGDGQGTPACQANRAGGSGETSLNGGSSSNQPSGAAQ